MIIIGIGIIFSILMIFLDFFIIGVGINTVLNSTKDNHFTGILISVLGVILAIASCFCMIRLILYTKETSINVLGKGIIETITSETTINGETINKSKTYYLKIEDNQKIIVSEEEWKNTKDKYIYIPSKAKFINE